MTAHEALEALKLAPSTNEPSKVNPKFTQKQMVENAVKTLGNLLYSRSNLQPNEAKMICAIVQDWPDPVALHFTYGKDGKIYVAYNRDELTLKQTPNREKTASEKLAEKYAKDQDDAYLRLIREQMMFPHPPSPYPQDFYTQKPLLALPKPTVVQAKSPAPVVPEKKPEPPKPEPKPDVKSPTFVLKRPKL
jgi:hypothetical protein